ncbi:unnamed protein product [Rhizophagus irregularis]|nr:unnamed protein product [Rhizophagus irregularis]
MQQSLTTHLPIYSVKYFKMNKLFDFFKDIEFNNPFDRIPRSKAESRKNMSSQISSFGPRSPKGTPGNYGNADTGISNESEYEGIPPTVPESKPKPIITTVNGNN